MLTEEVSEDTFGGSNASSTIALHVFFDDTDELETEKVVVEEVTTDGMKLFS